jgi:2-methylaconitate isomerase
VPGVGQIEVSMVDAANGCVFVAAQSLGLKGTEMPDAIERNAALLQKLAAIRLHASMAMGIGRDIEEARSKTAVPYVGFVSAPQDAISLSGERVSADTADLTVRMISNGQPHRALPLTASLCTAVAAHIEGSVVNRFTRAGAGTGGDLRLRLAMPSGVLTVGAEVARRDGAWEAKRGSFYRTARRLFDGCVYFQPSAKARSRCDAS